MPASAAEGFCLSGFRNSSVIPLISQQELRFNDWKYLSRSENQTDRIPSGSQQSSVEHTLMEEKDCDSIDPVPYNCFVLTEQDKQWIQERLEKVETNLLTEFHKWASPVELRQRSHAAVLRALDA
jgi:hypothetical protein